VYWIVPKLWTDTIEAHKQSVQDAVLDGAAALIAESGISAVTMSAVASTAGIGRATLYKYFPDVETILGAWHQRQIARHLSELETIAARPAEPMARLHAVLEAYLRNAFGARGHAASMPHATEHVVHGRAHLRGFLAHLIDAATGAGAIRRDVPADELAAYALAALDGAAHLTTKAATGRLLELTLDGMKPASRAR
jgi:AcrR family transcriptional regulator